MANIRTYLSIGCCILFLLIPIAVVGTSGPTVTQSPSSVTAEPGSTITISVTFNATGYNAPALDLTTPPGWKVTEYTTDGGTYRSEKQQWVWLSGGIKEITYTINIPENASEGDALQLEGSAINPSTDEFVRDLSRVDLALTTTTATTVRTATPPEITTTDTVISTSVKPTETDESRGADTPLSTDTPSSQTVTIPEETSTPELGTPTPGEDLQGTVSETTATSNSHESNQVNAQSDQTYVAVGVQGGAESGVAAPGFSLLWAIFSIFLAIVLSFEAT